MIQTLAKALYDRDVYGFISVDFVSFPDPYKNNENPLFWANGMTVHYSSLNTIEAFNKASTGYRDPIFSSEEEKTFNIMNRRIITSIPFINQKALPSIHFRSFFHLARLENMFFDISTKRGIIFLVADTLQAGTIGIISSDFDLTRSYQKLLKCLDFLRKQNVEDNSMRYQKGNMKMRGDLVPFGEVYGGVKICLKLLTKMTKGDIEKYKIKNF